VRDRAKSPNTIAANSVAAYSVLPPPPGSGRLFYEYYEIGSPALIPDYGTLTAKASGWCNKIDLTRALRADNFGFRFTGTVSVPAAGEYTFYTNSDEGSNLYINGSLVVNNDGWHPVREASGKVTLPAGKHQLVVTYFEIGGDTTLQVSWAGPSFAKTELVPDSPCFISTTSLPSPIIRPAAGTACGTAFSVRADAVAGRICVRVRLPRQARGRALVELYTAGGRLVGKSAAVPGETGFFTMKFSNAGAPLPAGIYLCRVSAGGFNRLASVISAGR
jgi:hypothetical protein